MQPHNGAGRNSPKANKKRARGQIQTKRAICLTITSFYGIIISVTNIYQREVINTNDTTKYQPMQAAAAFKPLGKAAP